MNEDKKYKRLIENLGSEYFFYSHDMDGHYSYISPSVTKILGYTVEEAFGGLVKYKTDSELNKRTFEILKKSASGERQKTFELELYTKSRDKKVIEITESPVVCDDGTVCLIEGIAHDITERKKTEQIIKEQNLELKKQKEEMEATLQNLRKTQSQLIHSEKMGALGNLIAGIAHEINTPIGAIRASVDNISVSLDSSINSLYRLFTRLTKHDLMAFLRIMDLIGEKPATLTSKEKRQIKRKVLQELKEANIDNAFSVADLLMYLNVYDHTNDIIALFRNTSDAEFILKALKDVYSIRKNSDNIEMAVDKASKVVFALKKFTHKDQGEEQKEKTNLLDNIETVLTLHYNQIKQGIEVVTNYDKIPLINCYPDCLVQVWTNLISNAIQAMNNQGTLSIDVKDLGESVKVCIADTGCGIPEENLKKIFEPFFTTKKAGEGTGIGLDLVKGILDKHNAKLDLKSEVGVGTTFCIELPIN